MEAGELVNVAVNAPHAEEGCPFCRPEEHVNEENVLRADYDEDTEADNDTDNSSGTLAKNLVERPQGPPREVPDVEQGEDAPFIEMPMTSAGPREWHDRVYDAGKVPVLYGAHHVIPGNDGLAKSTLYTKKKLGPVDNGPDVQNVGYNINSSMNGMWLPGNYAVRPLKGGKQKSWGEMDGAFKKAYAFLAMLDTGRQFHDAHKPYSGVVKQALTDLAELLDQMDDKGCPICGKGSDPADPPYHLNSRLNAISNHLSNFLRRATRFWKFPMFTSSFAKSYKDYVDERGGLQGARKELEKLRRQKRVKGPA